MTRTIKNSTGSAPKYLVEVAPKFGVADSNSRALLSQLSTLGVASAKDIRVSSLYEITGDPRLNHRVETVSGVLAEPAAELLRNFFRKRRELGEK